MGFLQGSGLLSTLQVEGRSYRYVDIGTMAGAADLPYSLKVLLENVLRTAEDEASAQRYLTALVDRDDQAGTAVVPFTPARVVLQDMAGAPVLHDLVALREAIERLGGDPGLIHPLAPAELVVDHSVVVDHYGSRGAFGRNVALEFNRNHERYRFLRWAQSAFNNFRVVPPGTGIVHQVNIEYLARGVMTQQIDGELVALLDTCVGTDSHTTMVNGLGVLGWGVGGIEAGAALLGLPISLVVPAVVGVELVGAPAAGVTATDIVLALTELLRGHGVVGKIVEFHGCGLAGLPVAHRATIANMSPEFGSTAAIFPIDRDTLDYYRLTGRSTEQVALIEAYARAQGLWSDGTQPAARYTERLVFDLSTVVPSIAGPRRPQDRIDLDRARDQFRTDLPKLLHEASRTDGTVTVDVGQEIHALGHGTLAIAAITSCTNTSNPAVMMTAALLARNAVARGLSVPPWVKTSMAPGSQVVTRYLEEAGLWPSLEALGFHVVGYGCTTCMGNSGPMEGSLSRAAQDQGLVLASVLSGNRNFEGRISPDVRMNYLASPPLVIAYAIAGTMDVDIVTEPLGRDNEGKEVYLRDLWPPAMEVEQSLADVVRRSMYTESYRDPFAGPELWRQLEVPKGEVYAFDPSSTYLRSSPFFADVGPTPEPVRDIHRARVLVKLGDSVTTDHISPVGAIRADSPAGRYLTGLGVSPQDFNSYGSRRGNHEVMVRGTFANVRLRNQLLDGVEGGLTLSLLDSKQRTIYDAAMDYAARDVPLLVLAGKEYGSGSARDYAAKGTKLLGVRAVLVESFERIHRSNLVGMGVVPLEYLPGQAAEGLGLDGTEEFSVTGLAGFTEGGWPQIARVQAIHGDGRTTVFDVRVRVDTPAEAQYIRHGGILPYILRSMLEQTAG